MLINFKRLELGGFRIHLDEKAGILEICGRQPFGAELLKELEGLEYIRERDIEDICEYIANTQVITALKTM